MSQENKKRGNKESQYAIRQRGQVLLLSGKYRHKEISEILGVSVGTVRGWSSKLKKSRNILKSNKKRGRPLGNGKLLNKHQENRIIKIIKDKTPKQMKLEFYLWSVGAIMELIEQKFGIKLSESSMRNYLRSWGFTTQRPATRYSRRDDIVIERWLTEDYPKISKRAEEERAEIHWLDEASVNNQVIYQRSYAPKGETPVAEKPSKKERINMISTVTNRGKMRFKLSEGSINKEVLIEFLENLIKDTEQKVFVIMDNLPAHKSQKVKDWAEENKGKIELFYLPPYAPEHNPDEYLNNAVKQNVHTKSGLSKTKKQLKSNTLSIMRSLQKQPQKIISFFKTKNTAYAA